MSDELLNLDLGGKKLRPYQARLIENVRDLVRQGKRRIIICSATGSGKTLISCGIIKLSAQKGSWSMFMAPRRELLKQTSDQLTDCDVRHSFIAAGFEEMAGSDCLLASKDTLVSRVMRRKKIPVPKTNVLVVDECVSGDTLIHTDIGTIPISEARDAKFVLSFDGNKPVWRRILRYLPRGKNQTIVLSTSSGRKIQCTKNHPVWTKNGWVPAGALKVGDSLFSASVDADFLSPLSGTSRRRSGLSSEEGTVSQGSSRKKNGKESVATKTQTGHCASAAVARLSLRCRLACSGKQEGVLSSPGFLEDISSDGQSSPCLPLSGKQFLEPCSATRPSLTRTPRAPIQESTGIIHPDSETGSFTNASSCLGLEPLLRTRKTLDSETCGALGDRDVIRACQKSTRLSFGMGKRRSLGSGLTQSEKSGSHGGSATTEAQATILSCCTRKDTQGKNLRSLRTGSRKSTEDTLLSTKEHGTSLFAPEEGLPRRSGTLSCSSCQRQCDTSWTEVTEICEAGEVEVYDLDVEQDHCFWANGLLVHNCHFSLATKFNALLHLLEKENPGLITIGLSATPGRADGKGLGDYWDAITTAASYEELREGGYLVPARVFCFDAPDMRGVRSLEWESEAARRMDRPKLVGDIVENWLAHTPDRQTFVFGATVAHSIHLCEEFVKHGVRAVHIDDSTPPEERDRALSDLKNGRIQVLTNCDICTYGVDIPEVSCVVLASPCRSLVRYRQRCGRALRPFSAKSDCCLLDHAGGVLMHGFPDDDIDWPLERSRSVDEEYQKKRVEGKAREPMVCQKCHCTYSGRPDCPNCGARQAKKGRDIAVQKGLLKEIKRDTKKLIPTTLDAKQRTWHGCIATMANKGLTCGAAAKMYHSQVGEMPWETEGLRNLPERNQWKHLASDVFPRYVKEKASV